MGQVIRDVLVPVSFEIEFRIGYMSNFIRFQMTTHPDSSKIDQY